VEESGVVGENHKPDTGFYRVHLDRSRLDVFEDTKVVLTVGCVDISGIGDHPCLNFRFIVITV
jgi:hypothetical protein